MNDNGESGVSGSASAIVMNGLRAWYFSDTNLEQYHFDRIDPTIDLSWNASDGDSVYESDGFSARWEGQLKTVGKRVYLFTLSASGAVRFWVDDSLLIDTWDTGGDASLADSIELNKTVPIRIEYTTTASQPAIQLTWDHHPTWGGNWSESVIIPQDSLIAAPGGYEVSVEKLTPRMPAIIRNLSVTTGIHGLTFRVPEKERYRYRVFTAAGRVVLAGNGRHGGMHTVPTATLPSGLYIVQVETRTEAVTQSFFRLR